MLFKSYRVNKNLRPAAAAAQVAAAYEPVQKHKVTSSIPGNIKSPPVYWGGLIMAYIYSANFICMPGNNAQKRFIVFIMDCIMDWSRNYTYKLSKCFVEQVSFKSGLERVNIWSLLHAEG